MGAQRATIVRPSPFAAKPIRMASDAGPLPRGLAARSHKGVDPRALGYEEVALAARDAKPVRLLFFS
jgi:hypothetical protein